MLPEVLFLIIRIKLMARWKSLYPYTKISPILVIRDTFTMSSDLVRLSSLLILWTIKRQWLICHYSLGGDIRILWHLQRFQKLLLKLFLPCLKFYFRRRDDAPLHLAILLKQLSGIFVTRRSQDLFIHRHIFQIWFPSCIDVSYVHRAPFHICLSTLIVLRLDQWASQSAVHLSMVKIRLSSSYRNEFWSQSSEFVFELWYFL